MTLPAPLPASLLAGVLAASPVRPAAVARGRRVVASGRLPGAAVVALAVLVAHWDRNDVVVPSQCAVANPRRPGRSG